MTNSFVVKPIIVYDNADTAKVDIFADNRNKSGVYLTFWPFFYYYNLITT